MIASYGEALVDLIEQADGRFLPCLGGSVSNFCVAAARQGVPSTYLNPLSCDGFGRRFAALYQANNVIQTQPEPSPCPTALAVVTKNERNEPSYIFHRETVADRDITLATLQNSWPEAVRILHTGCLTLTPQDIAQTLGVLQFAQSQGVVLSVDANIRLLATPLRGEYLADVEKALRQAHIIKLSDEDLAALLPKVNPEHPEALAAHYFAASPTIELIVYTRGAMGATLITRGQQVTLPTPQGLKVVDTVGAGDCFAAALLACLYRLGPDVLGLIRSATQQELRDALRHALAAAGINVTRAGCDPATWEETLAATASRTL
ncbi:MAG: PfkB family carbohydrate kinase [Burkholderiaceae bacterium]|nr:PfkB family carbohydrate kinase [Burkholderiaceae bacterium]